MIIQSYNIHIKESESERKHHENKAETKVTDETRDDVITKILNQFSKHFLL